MQHVALVTKYVYRCLLVLLSTGVAAFADSNTASSFLGQPATYRINANETLADIARKYHLGFVEMLAANPGVDPWGAEPASLIHLPTQHILPNAPHRGIVINIGDFRLYWFAPDGGAVSSWPVAIAREGFSTPLGRTTVVKRRVNPAWMPPQSARAENPELPSIIAPGPLNPLGKYAINLGFQGIIIHGTNKPWGIGRRVSRGCLRMYPEDIKTLFQQVTLGTEVTIVDQPVKFGWREKQLFVEIHPTAWQADQLETQGYFTREVPLNLGALARQAAGKYQEQIDWMALSQAAKQRTGMPVLIFAASD